MIIINADDWGRSPAETDAALRCFEEGRITSVSAMVFMNDSFRAAEYARDTAIDVGLHLNLSQQYTGEIRGGVLDEYHNCIVGFFTLNKYTFLVYNPAIRKQLRYDFEAQFEEFLRLYGKAPSHIDGHHHLHLCTNMLFDRIIPSNERVRRSFTFRHGEKNLFNRVYRRIVDLWLARRYTVTDHFFALSQCIQYKQLERIAELSKAAVVELMTHPAIPDEYDYLLGNEYHKVLHKLEKGTYSSL